MRFRLLAHALIAAATLLGIESLADCRSFSMALVVHPKGPKLLRGTAPLAFKHQRLIITEEDLPFDNTPLAKKFEGEKRSRKVRKVVAYYHDKAVGSVIYSITSKNPSQPKYGVDLTINKLELSGDMSARARTTSLLMGEILESHSNAEVVWAIVDKIKNSSLTDEYRLLKAAGFEDAKITVEGKPNRTVLLIDEAALREAGEDI